MSSTTTSATASAPPVAAAAAGAAGAPLTMADWAARQRALKEQDRKSKTASAEALRNYRGVGALRGEETMLTALKEQDRKKKEETAEQMRHYRGGAGLRDEDTKLSMIRQQDRQHKQDAERILHDYRDKESDVKNPTRPEQTRIIPDAVYSSGGKWNPEEEIAPGVVSNIRESFSASNQSESPMTTATASTSRSVARDPTPTATAAVASSSISTPSSYPPEAAATTKTFFNNSGNHHPSNAATPSIPTPTKPAPQENKGYNNGYSAAATAVAVATTTATTVSSSAVKRLDVKFSFGIVSLADTPSLDGYMVAVKEIVEQGLMDDAQLGSHVSWNPEFPPFVNEVEKDDTYKDQSGRSNVKRFLVKASVPIFVKSGFSSQSARRGVIAVLQQAIQSGVLLSSAASGKVLMKRE